MGSGGGGQSTTSPQQSPEVQQLQATALPQIQAMLEQNPLSNYAAWQPRQVAGSNPFYDQLFQYAPSLAAPTQGYNVLFGGGSSGQGGGTATAPAPSSGGEGGGYMGGSIFPTMPTGGALNLTGVSEDSAPLPPPQFQSANIQDIIQQNVQSALDSAAHQAAAPFMTLSGPVGDKFYINGNPVGSIGQSFQLGDGSMGYQVSNGQLYYQNPNEGAGWHNSYGGYTG